MNTHCIYCTFDTANFKYYIGYQSQSDRIKNGEYYGSPMNKNAQEAWADKDNLFVTILGYFNSEAEGYVAETELQTFMNAAGDENSWNGSNDSFKQGSKNKENLGSRIIKTIGTWFGSGDKIETIKKEKVLSPDELAKMSRYIKEFNYFTPEHYPAPKKPEARLLEEDIESASTETQKSNIVELSNWLGQARKDCYDRGYKTGAAPFEETYKNELENIKVELDGQLEDRLFNLKKEIVSIESRVAHLPKGSKPWADAQTKVAEINFEVDYISEELKGDKFYNILQVAFKKGFNDRIEHDF